jgi:hypothetical protein
MWMNEAEIDYCHQNLETKVLKDGAMFLRSFKNLINQISDGWAYWSYGTKCSDDLQTLIQTPPICQADITQKQVQDAKKKILRFLGRCKQTKDNPIVCDFILNNK